MNRILITLGAFVATSLFLQAGQTRTLDQSLLRQIRAEAARNHPAVTAGEKSTRAAQTDVQAVRLWDDPTLGVGFMGASRAMRRDDGDLMLGVEQPLPKPGLYAAKRRKAEALARAEKETTQRSAKEAANLAAKAAIELALADESIAIEEKQIEWLRAMVKSAQEKAANPDASAADALRLETELAKEEAFLDSNRRTRKGLAEELNITLGRSIKSSWSTLRLPAGPVAVPIVSAEIARIPHANPEVRALREKASAAAAEVRIADRERLPQVSLGVDTATDSSRGDVRSSAVGVKLTLPWFQRKAYQAEVDAAQSRASAADSQVDVLEREIATQVTSHITSADSAATQARAYSGKIRDKAEEAATSIEEAWTTSKASLTDVLDANRALFSIRLEQRRLVATQLVALEDLQALVPQD